jgi:ribosomal protein S18 acetylase RimI-like enzyme
MSKSSPRPATVSDVPALNALARAAYAIYIPVIGREPGPMAIDWGTLLTKQEIWILDGTLGSAVGSLALEVKLDHIVVWSIAVTPEHQHRGIGRRLMAFAERRARELRRPEVRLFTNARMERNITLYRRLGYAETRREHLADRVLVHMSKPGER